MKKKNWAAIALMMVTVMTVGCSSSDEDNSQPVVCPVEPPTTLELTRAEQEMVSNSNDFTFNLFRIARDEVKSQILSPISITYALGMLNNGAAGETQQQINKVLGFSETGADGINEFCYKMLQRASTLDDQTKVLIGNTIYLNKDKGYDLLPAFAAKANAFYDAEPESRSFSDGKTRDVINKWGSDHTMGMIKETLRKDEFDENAVSYLLNAIYFKGAWTQNFDKNMTTDEDFEHAGPTKESIVRPMMRQMAEFDYTETETFQALRLPYGNGAYQMTVLLPRNIKYIDIQKGDDINKVLQSLTAESWQQILQQMSPATVDLKLPRFESGTDINLIPIMKKLGMTKAFDPLDAEFQYFCTFPQIYIDLMKQVARIKLDEEGTEAAAVTIIAVKDGAAGPSEPKYVTFHANHPFLYVISEKSTGAIFFIGQFTGY
ncbi:MAG: serpin family protein [Prevotella sp.]|nr:serpin family protein [Prevotella sp.]